MIPSDGHHLTYLHPQVERPQPTTHARGADDAISDWQQFQAEDVTAGMNVTTLRQKRALPNGQCAVRFGRRFHLMPEPSIHLTNAPVRSTILTFVMG